MKNLLRISIVAYIHLTFNTHNIEITFTSVGYCLFGYAATFNGCKAAYSLLSGKTHGQIKREVLGV